MEHRAGAPGSTVRSVLAGAAATAVIAASAWLGVLIVDRSFDRQTAVATSTPSPVATPPADDVRGRDLADLPRHPDSVRTAYSRDRQGSTIVTTVEYLAPAELDDVRAHYRRMFREHRWEVIELDFSGGEWVFLVERGQRVALVELEGDVRATTVQVELEQPVSGAAPRPARSPAPAPPAPPPPPPPGDDDDGDDGDDDGGDD
jgi:hypothetical protein